MDIDNDRFGSAFTTLLDLIGFSPFTSCYWTTCHKTNISIQDVCLTVLKLNLRKSFHQLYSMSCHSTKGDSGANRSPSRIDHLVDIAAGSLQMKLDSAPLKREKKESSRD